jgi:hypothetical protein
MTGPDLTRVHRRRTATQRVSAAGLARGADVVRLLLAVQSQDAPMAAWSLALRMPEGTTYAQVLAEQRAGGWVRTHVLRPTWHHVAPEDLRWLQRLTGPKVESSMGARHRQLELTDLALERAVEALRELLAGAEPMTRRELTDAFAARGLPASGEQVAHQLLVAELRAVVCSGPPRGAEHTYVLVDDAVPPGPLDHLTGDAARDELVGRFFAGHGPAGERDLLRWSTLTLTEIRAALARAGDRLDHWEVDGERLWFDPSVPARTTRDPGAVLVPTFDELTLSYADTGLPRRDPSSPRPRLVNAIGGGTVILGGEDVGAFTRRVTRTGVDVAVVPDLPLAAEEVDRVQAAAGRLAAFLGLPLRWSVERG